MNKGLKNTLCSKTFMKIWQFVSILTPNLDVYFCYFLFTFAIFPNLIVPCYSLWGNIIKIVNNFNIHVNNIFNRMDYMRDIKTSISNRSLAIKNKISFLIIEGYKIHILNYTLPYSFFVLQVNRQFYMYDYFKMLAY